MESTDLERLLLQLLPLVVQVVQARGDVVGGEVAGVAQRRARRAHRLHARLVLRHLAHHGLVLLHQVLHADQVAPCVSHPRITYLYLSTTLRYHPICRPDCLSILFMFKAVFGTRSKSLYKACKRVNVTRT
jgi:hypothetical protein